MGTGMGMSEVWKDIPGYEGRYQASTEGRIRSVDQIREVKTKNGRTFSKFFAGRVLTPWRSSGYFYVDLGHHDRHTVHSLIALTFLGPCPQGFDVCHEDGVRTNNLVSNLRYGSHAENLQDEYRWNRSWNAKLSTDEVRRVRKELASGRGCSDLGRQYGVRRNVILDIKKGRTFSWLE